MAMTKCKECKQEVSTSAKKCPNCGVSNPGVTAKEMAIGTAGLVVVILLVIAWFSPDDEPATESGESGQSQAEAQAEDRAEAEACREDLQCWGDENWSMAEVVCADEVERMAKYDVKWTDSFGENRLSRQDWLDKEAGTIRYYGDQVQFQNGYGAYQNYIYRCDYDPETETVINLEMEPGRI